jgi:hypothetical protein
MEPNERFDTDAAGILLIDTDVATALAASYRPQPASVNAASRSHRSNLFWWNLGIIAGLVLVILWLLS